MSNEFRITIVSPPDRARLVAEVFFGDEQVAEVNQDQGTLQVEIYPRQSGAPWSMPYAEFVEAMRAARERLIGR